tara:strand:- start:58 stop:369 length:312 start_codon:yes stop_codon:yes gene_type:complete
MESDVAICLKSIRQKADDIHGALVRMREFITPTHSKVDMEQYEKVLLQVLARRGVENGVSAILHFVMATCRISLQRVSKIFLNWIATRFSFALKIVHHSMTCW